MHSTLPDSFLGVVLSVYHVFIACLCKLCRGLGNGPVYLLQNCKDYCENKKKQGLCAAIDKGVMIFIAATPTG
jgi:hypothetical protein